eukprot:TRINITY_DN6203_c0_g1_i6.p1 TRINITY_DN6203_c0_g1~~TRINITY_DN6203_c0_g1_i6.p1  ORF type:complete len:386 (+),score=27.24 TRINITY_DN6203_c0_g1_i6:180-1337(+)
MKFSCCWKLATVACFLTTYLLIQSIPYFKKQHNIIKNLPIDYNQQIAKIAYFITISVGEKEKVVNLLNKIIEAKNIYILHMDKKMAKNETDQIFKNVNNLNATYQNIYVLPQYSTSYLGIAYVDVDLTAMAYALSVSMHWTHYINLSPSDYPLLTQQQIQTLLGQFPQNLSFMEAHLTNCEEVRRRIFTVRYDSAVAGFTDNQFFKSTVRISHPQGFKILKGGQWKIFSRQMASYFAHSEDGWARRQLVFFANTKIPMEHFFQTAGCNSVIVNSSVRIASTTYKDWHNVDWGERRRTGKLGPNYINLNILRNALSQGTLFARKFGFDEASETCKKALDQLHAGIEISYLNETFTKEKIYENAKKYYFAAIQGKTCEEILKDYQPC